MLMEVQKSPQAAMKVKECIGKGGSQGWRKRRVKGHQLGQLGMGVPRYTADWDTGLGVGDRGTRTRAGDARVKDGHWNGFG